MANVEFNYQGQIILIQCNENDKLKKIIQNFCIKVQKSSENLCFPAIDVRFTSRDVYFASRDVRFAP